MVRTPVNDDRKYWFRKNSSRWKKAARLCGSKIYRDEYGSRSPVKKPALVKCDATLYHGCGIKGNAK